MKKLSYLFITVKQIFFKSLLKKKDQIFESQWMGDFHPKTFKLS